MKIKNVISDMDGVIYRGHKLIPGAKEFVERMLKDNIKFLFLTNNSEQTPIDLLRKLEKLGIEGLTEEHFFTSAKATAMFLAKQKKNATAYVIGGGGLVNELYQVGFSISETEPDYVVVGKTSAVNFSMIKKASNLIREGARFIGTNPDVLDPSSDGLEPACGVFLDAIESATGKSPYVVGKPNPMMMRLAKEILGVRAHETLMVGDRMDTDILGGMEAGMQTALVLSGVSSEKTIEEFPYRPTFVFDSVADIFLSKLKEE